MTSTYSLIDLMLDANFGYYGVPTGPISSPTKEVSQLLWDVVSEKVFHCI